jgi:predicted transcriptional regulator
MTTLNQPSDASDGLALLLGPRQAQIMRLFWAFGSATAREIHTQLVQDTTIAYTTVTTICRRLAEMGLLLQERVTEPDGSLRYPPTNRYTPLVSAADFVRTEVSQQLDRLLTHFGAIIYDHLARSAQQRSSPGTSDQMTDLTRSEILAAYLDSEQISDGQPIDTMLLDLIDSLRRRAEAAERQAAAYAAEADRARQQTQAATNRTAAAERQAQEAVAEARRAHQRTLLIEEETAAALRRSQLQRYSKAKPIIEHYDPSGVCRVCGQKAAPLIKRRRDGLRLCDNLDCKREAHRRDNLVKQRQFQDRRRLQQAQQGSPA